MSIHNLKNDTAYYLVTWSIGQSDKSMRVTSYQDAKELTASLNAAGRYTNVTITGPGLTYGLIRVTDLES